MPRVKQAKDTPVMRTNYNESSDHQIGQDTVKVMPATGPIDRSAFRDEFQAVDGPKMETKAAELAFGEEPVEVMVATTTDKNSERMPCVSVNGVNQYFVRGQRMVVKRKFIEGLARAKKTTLQTIPTQDQDGSDTMAIVPDTGIKYPFAVTRDDNPKGRAWLEKVLAEG